MSSPVRRPVLVLPSSILFPREVATIELELGTSVSAIDRVNALDPRLIVAPLWDSRAEATPQNVIPVGTLARLVNRMRLPEGGLRVVLQGVRRTRLEGLEFAEGCFYASCSPPAEEGPFTLEHSAAVDRVVSLLQALFELDPRFSGELPATVGLHRDDPSGACDLAIASLPLTYPERAVLFAEEDPKNRLAGLQALLERWFVRARASRTVDDDIARRLRREVLQEKLEALRLELGEPGAGSFELRDLEDRVAAAEISPAARELLARRLEHLRRLPPESAEALRIKSHLTWTLELPWQPALERAELPFSRVAKALSKSHIGLSEVKVRIAEILAVNELGGEARGTVLCFVGPPGTGKSSMARAVATALGRRFLSIPLGAITHEREIVGQESMHQGATPGAILSGLHRCGTQNPVILLDEIDKVRLGGGGGGALLSLLDPEHNAEFLDQYLGVPFDLSQCLFLATANETESIPDALLDRIETLHFDGYTESEKIAIARTHLIPRARAHAGLERGDLSITAAALKALIRGYTEEAGVRHLQRWIDSLARKAAVRVAGGRRGIHVNKKDLVRLLGPRTVEVELRLCRSAIGVATGLAWTSAGGSLLPIEVLAMPGAGRLILTGHLGEIMRESVQTALSYVRTCFGPLGIDHDLLDEIDLHLHFPAASTPKDGPSAGVAIATALVSLLTRRRSRHDVAMTGEMSLLGSLLAVGGLREKLLAAKRCGLAEVIVPKRNTRDIERLPAEIRAGLKIHLVEDAQEAFEIGLLRGSSSHSAALRSTSGKITARPAHPRRRRRHAG